MGWSKRLLMSMLITVAGCGGGGGGGGGVADSCSTSVSAHFESTPPTQATVGQQYVYATNAVYSCIPFITRCGGIDARSLPAGATIYDPGAAVLWVPSLASANTSASFSIASKPDVCGRTASQSWVVQVFPAPTIQSFTVNKTSILAGEPVLLNAVFQGNGFVDGIGPVTSGVPINASFSVDTNVRLRVSNAMGLEVSQVLFIDVLGPPTISGFSASPSTIPQGSSTTLQFAVSDGQTLRLDPGSIDVSSLSALTVSPAATTTYTLTANNAVGSNTATVTVTVVPPAVITSFSATPSSAALGASVALSAVFQGTQAQIYRPGVHGSNELLGSVVSGGTLNSGPLYASTLFQLVVSGSQGNVGTTLQVALTGARTFQPTAGQPIEPRRVLHAATLLNDGRVFITGGNGAGKTTELFDPSSQTFTAGPSLLEVRLSHTPILLSDGRVLIVDGPLSPLNPPIAEIFDPVTGTINSAGAVMNPAAAAGATPPVLLNDGRVLVAGSVRSSPTVSTFGAFIWDPVSATFSGLKPFADSAHEAYSNVRAIDGRVFFLRPSGTSEIFVPGADAFVAGPSHAVTRFESRAPPVRLPDGRLLITGGFVPDLTAAEIYDPTANSLTFVGVPNFPLMIYRGAGFLPDGRVFFAGGGDNSFTALPWAEIFDPATGGFTRVGGLNAGRLSNTATVLADGRVLVMGGCSTLPCQAEIYTP